MYHLIYILETALFLLCAQGVNSVNTVCYDALGLGDRNKVKDSQISASSEKSRRTYPASDGRIINENNVDGWCADPYSTLTQQWFRVDFKNTYTITSVMIVGLRGDQTQYVEKFSLKYSYDNVVWHNYTYKGHELLENTDKDSGEAVVFPYPITARCIGIYPREMKTNDLCMRVEFYGCTPKEVKLVDPVRHCVQTTTTHDTWLHPGDLQDCTIPVGMESGRIANQQITASSHRKGHFPYRGRLHNKTKRTKWGAWCAQKADVDPYLQIDLLRKRNVSGVATQGYRYKLFVQNYKVNYSTDGVTWLSCQSEQKRIKFEGNKDNDTVKLNELDRKVTAQYIRFIPTEWHYGDNAYPCMRVEIYECLPVKGSVPVLVDDRSQQIFDIDKFGNITFTCTMKGQAGILIDWYRKGVIIKESKSFKIQSEDLGDNHMQSKLSLYNVTIDENGVKYECQGRYPNVSRYTSYAVLLRVGEHQPPVEVRSKTETSVEIGVPYRLANITVEYWFEFRVVNDSEWTDKKFASTKKNIYSIMGLVPWTEYELRVTPVHREGYDPGRTSRIERFRTLQGVPDRLENVRTSQVNTDNATITWNAPSKDQIRGILKGYVIKVCCHGDESDIQEIGVTTSYIVRHLLPRTNYTVEVALKNERRQSPFNSVFFTTPPEITEPLTTAKPHSEANLEKLNQIEITDQNAGSVAVDVEDLTSVPKELNSRNVSTTADILRKIVETNATSATVGDSILKTISNVLDTEDSVLENSNSSSKFIKILEDFLVKGGEFSKNTSNIKIRIIKNFDLRDGILQQTFNSDSAILIPKEVLNKAKNKTMYFIYYKNGNLFKPKPSPREICKENGFTENVYQQSTAVMSSGVLGESVKNLTEKVIIKFHVNNPKAVTESSSCVYWDFDAAGGKGDWSNKGCKRQRVYNDTIECACDHMTNFAALIDVYAATSKACGVHADILQIVSYVGCCLSITGLALTIFTYMFFRRLRKELAAKILIQLCIALLCVMIVFVIGIERSRVGAIGCYIVAVLLHYFILAAFLWMLIEAHFMYLAFVKVWSQHGDHELLKCSFIAWGLPAIVVGVTMAVNLDNYGGGYYCRIEKIAFYTAFFAPVMCIIFVNLIVFAIIMYKLNTRPDSSLGRNRSAMMQRMKQAVGIMILVGLTWIFGALAISGVRLIFHYIFVFFNSIQGFCIFLFYCLSQKNVRDCWKALLTCQLKKLHKDKSFHTNTYDRRRCSTASTTHNATMSMARKKTSTSSANTAYPSHSMDTLTREFTSYNCTSETLPVSNEGSKPNNLNNFKLKDCNVQNGSASNGDIWKLMSNTTDQTPDSFKTDTPLTRSNSAETLCSDDSSENYHSYDLVASSEGSLVSVHSLAESQASDNRGFYSFVNADSCDNSVCGDSAPSTPGEVKRPMPNPTTNNNLLTVPPPTKRKPQQPKPINNDHLAIPDDFGKLIVNPSRGSVRGVRGVVETSVDTYDEDSDANVTPQSVRLTNNQHSDKFGPNECIDSPMYFAQNNRTNLKDRNTSTTDNAIGDVYL